MRQLPQSNSGASATENSRSRSNLCSDGSSAKSLSNGYVKEPILTRSKSRLRAGRRVSGRSPRKLVSPQKFADFEGSSRRKPDKSASSSPTTTSTKNAGTSGEKMYARHYKSYRGLNGVNSRRGDRSTNDHSSSSRTASKESSENTKRDSRRVKNYVTSVTRNRSVSLRNCVHQNGVSSPTKSVRNPSSRIRQVILNRRKKNVCKKRRGAESEDSSPTRSPTEDDSDGDQFHGKDKAGKRRSALWVLNCEAESFLFGETAAEKHEVELPPLAPPSPPPKKRRWRVNELGHLLEKSPILESKLRKSSSSESGNDLARDISPPRKRVKPEAQRTPRRVKDKKQKDEDPDMCSSNSAKPQSNQPQSPRPELLSPIPFLYSPDSIDYEARTVQFHQMLNNLDYGYSFEEPPVSEPWYGVFTRTETSIIPHTSFVNPLHEPVVLPYEMDKTVRRSRTKPIRNSRKSPRCHASTLAIMSSEKPTRSTRSSVTLDSSPSATVSNLASESTLQALLLPPPPQPPAPTPTPNTPAATSRLLSSPKYVPVTTRRRHLSSPRPQHTETKNELGAAQYLWDSIQYLSDPYVVSLLAGEDPEAAGNEQQDHSKGKLLRNNRCTNNNYVNCPVKSLVKNFEGSARKASLRSGDTSSVPPNGVATSRLVSVPKSSPRNQSHGTNMNGGHKISSPPVSPSATVNDGHHGMNGVSRRFTSRSPPLSSPTRQTVCHSRLSPKNSKGTNSKQSKTLKGSVTESDNGLVTHDKPNKKAIVLMADLFASSGKTNKISNWEEESLFVGDGLPPLPSWPV